MGPGLWEFKSGAGAGSSRAPGILGRRGDALPARGCLSSRAGCCSSGMECTAAPRPRLCQRGWAGGWLDIRAAAACCRLLRRPPATGIAVAGADGAASTPAASCSCTQPLLTPPFLELTPLPQPSFQARKDSSTSRQLCSVPLAGAVHGVRVQGAVSCLPRALDVLETP